MLGFGGIEGLGDWKNGGFFGWVLGYSTPQSGVHCTIIIVKQAIQGNSISLFQSHVYRFENWFWFVDCTRTAKQNNGPTNFIQYVIQNNLGLL